jgi:hypothetical protein
LLPQVADWQSNEKAQSARIFYAYYVKVNEDAEYQRAKQQHQQALG